MNKEFREFCNLIVEMNAPEIPEIQIQRQLSRRFVDFELNNDAKIDEQGEPHHFAMMEDSEPIDLEAALKEMVTKKSIKKELSSIERNNTWDLTKLPHDKRKFGVKWVFKSKLNPKVKVVMNKAWLVQGFS